VALLAAACFWPSIRLGLEWVDQGHIVYPAWLVARGALPYRDFHQLYGPSLFFLNGALMRWFGEDLLVLRLGLLAVKVALAVLVFLLSRRLARPAIALATTAWFVVLWSSPLWLFWAPYGVHYTLALGLAGVAVLLVRSAAVLPALAAGLCFGVAATFKQTTGLLGAVGVLVALASTRAEGGEADALAGVARLLRLAITVAAGLLVLAYPARARGTWTMALLTAPPALALIAEAIRDRGAERALRAGRGRLARVLAFGVGFASPLAAWAALYASHGALHDLVHDTLLGLPQGIDWYVPFERPAGPTLVFGAALAVGAAALAAPPARARTATLGLATLVVAGIVGRVLTRAAWSIVSWQLSDYLPAALVWVSAPLALRSGQAPRLLWWYGALTFVSLYPAADVAHALMVLPAVLPLLAFLLERAWVAAGERWLTRLLAAGLVGLPLLMPAEQSIAFLAGSVAARPSGAPVFARASGIWGGDPPFAEMRGVLEVLDRTAPAGARLLVLPSAQLLYFIADRPSPLPRAEMVLYLLTVGLLHPADARALASEDDMLTILRAAPPLIVRTDGEAWRLIAATYPALASWIDAAYVPVARVGPHEVLRPRGG
jgi:hypothetical protein